MHKVSLLRLSLVSGTLLCVSPVLAQQAAPAPAPPVPIVAAPAAPPDPLLLVIPAPPGAKLRVEMDARSEDLLGVMKSFLKGIGETGAAKPGEANSVTPRPAGQPAPPANPVAVMLENGNLADMLKDVNHVHFVVYELPAPPAPPMPAIVFPVKPHPKKLHPAPPASLLPDAAPVSPPPVTPAFDSNAFYEDAFSREGAHRILFTDADEYKLVMVGFPDRKGYAFAVSGAGYVAVSRSDGYPNLETLSAFISRVTNSVMNSTTLKHMMNTTMGGDKAPDKGDGKSEIAPR